MDSDTVPEEGVGQLEVLQESTERVVEDLRQVANERRDFALVHRVGDRDRVGEKEPHRRGGQHDADERDRTEQADAEALVPHHTSSTILPNCAESSRRRCAAAASARGKVRSMTGLSWLAK